MAGNHNSGPKKEKPFLDALRMELAGETGRKKLRRIAAKLLFFAEQGESWAIRELIDRLDGKAIQPQDITADITARTASVAMYPADMSPEELEKNIPKLLSNAETNTTH